MFCQGLKPRTLGKKNGHHSHQHQAKDQLNEGAVKTNSVEPGFITAEAKRLLHAMLLVKCLFLLKSSRQLSNIHGNGPRLAKRSPARERGFSVPLWTVPDRTGGDAPPWPPAQGTIIVTATPVATSIPIAPVIMPVMFSVVVIVLVVLPLVLLDLNKVGCNAQYRFRAWR
jgi:hypothetical protein